MKWGKLSDTVQHRDVHERLAHANNIQYSESWGWGIEMVMNSCSAGALEGGTEVSICMGHAECTARWTIRRTPSYSLHLLHVQYLLYGMTIILHVLD